MSSSNPLSRPHTSYEDLVRLRRACEVLLRDYGLALDREFLANRDPAATTRAQRGKLSPLLTELRERAGKGETSGAFLKGLADQTEAGFEALAERAKAAFAHAPKHKGAAQSYNALVGKALSEAPQALRTQGRAQLEGAVDKLVDAYLPSSLVRPEQQGDFNTARQHMKSRLKQLVSSTQAVEETFFLAEKAVTAVALFLHEKLSIQGELQSLKGFADGTQALSPEQAKALDRQAGQLGKASAKADQQVALHLRQVGALAGKTALGASALAAGGPVGAGMALLGGGLIAGSKGKITQRVTKRFDAEFVLDPARRFLAKVEAGSGITLERGKVRVKLSSSIVVVDPLAFDKRTKATIDQALKAQIGKAWSLEANYQRTWERGAGFSAQAFDASLGYERGPWAGSASYANQEGAHQVNASFGYERQDLSVSGSYASDGLKAHELSLEAQKQLTRRLTGSAGYGGTLEQGRWSGDTLNLGLQYSRGDELSAGIEYELREGRDYEVKATLEWRF